MGWPAEAAGESRPPPPRVLLIGGTSHAGKSTLATEIAARLGWACHSTDKLARHPGRPWRTPPAAVPDHVREHYLAHPPEALLAAVLEHYRENVLPPARTLITAHSSETATEGLVLEGSALLPELVADSAFPRVAAVWLVPNNEQVEQRIRLNSRYPIRSPAERSLIDAFVARSHRYNDWLRAELHQRNLPAIDPGAALPDATWIDDLLSRLRLDAEAKLLARAPRPPAPSGNATVWVPVPR